MKKDISIWDLFYNLLFFEGRITTKSCWVILGIFILFIRVIPFILEIIFPLLLFVYFPLILIGYLFYIYIVGITMFVQKLHDLNLSGWWWWQFTPIIGIISYLVLPLTLGVLMALVGIKYDMFIGSFIIDGIFFSIPGNEKPNNYGEIRKQISI